MQNLTKGNILPCAQAAQGINLLRVDLDPALGVGDHDWIMDVDTLHQPQE